ncbi:9401_t:CDS:1 [Dentiscutata erythropus]|uniref:9401_t:CDS:1 n=1 Tax=Dentiscutata erythropus TaxID=1348616 RepID=A0A9N9HXT5_9GLOM|nr:9401_t:CDS:1 [Dentiscutata erythropus]
MGKKEHKFRSFFTLTEHPTNKSNKKAICICCIEANGYEIAKDNKDCWTTNIFKYCKLYLKNCLNFSSKYIEEEQVEILALDEEEINSIKKKSCTTYNSKY